jgi:hypothetical protein
LTSQPSRLLHSPTIAGAKIAGQHGGGDLIHKPVPHNRTSVALAKTEGRAARKAAEASPSDTLYHITERKKRNPSG